MKSMLWVRQLKQSNLLPGRNSSCPSPPAFKVKVQKLGYKIFSYKIASLFYLLLILSFSKHPDTSILQWFWVIPNDNHLKTDWKCLVIHVTANIPQFFLKKDINRLAMFSEQVAVILLLLNNNIKPSLCPTECYLIKLSVSMTVFLIIPLILKAGNGHASMEGQLAVSTLC